MIEIKNRFTFEVIFKSEKETIKEAVLEAVEKNTDLRNADLRNADLRNANLRNANLSDADLSNANLSNANLSDANLSDANLSDANLNDADLLCSGNMKEIKTIQIDTYKIGFTIDTLQIGCQKHKIEDWEKFDDSKISKMDNGALEWWKKWKDFIFKAIELSK